MASSANRSGGDGLTVLVIDQDGARRQTLLRAHRSHSAVAASLCEAFPLAERMMPDFIAISADFLAEPDVEGLVRLADILGCRHFFYADAEARGASGDWNGQPVIQMAPDDRVETLMNRVRQGNEAPSGGRHEREQPGLILIGASTGGVAAVEAVLRDFPADCPPTLVVQHIREGFVQNLVRRLGSCCRPQVIEADHGHRLRRGTVYFASDANRHLVVTRKAMPRCELEASPPRNGHRPAVDVLFESAVGWGPSVSAALLTGMGADGAAGLGALRRAGAHTIAQDKGTSVVWGMPRVAIETGAAAEVLPLGRIGEALLRRRSAERRNPVQGQVP